MKQIFKYTIFASILMTALAAFAQAAPFTAGNVVVCRVGAVGGGALSGAAFPVFLDEYTPTTPIATLVQSIALPTVDDGPNQTLTLSGSATSECLMTRSADGKYLMVFGYDAAVGTAAVAGTSTTAVLRVIARVGQDGFVNTSTTTTSFSTGNPRGIASTNGTDIWLTGSNTGVVYTTLGGSGTGTIIQSTVTNLRSANIFGGQLYTTSMSGAIRLATVGTGTPTTTGQVLTNLPGFPTTGSANSPYEYFFCDLSDAVAGIDTVYVADDSATLGGVQKYSLVGGTWTLNGTFVAPPIRGLTGIVNMPGPIVTLFATGTATNANTLSIYADVSGYNARPMPMNTKSGRGGELVPSPPTVIATAAANTVFRGVAFAPFPVTAATASVGGRVTESNGRPIANAFITISGGDLSQPITTTTGSFGYYNFEGLAVGQNYVITVTAKRHRFNNGMQVLTLSDSLDNMNFVANPQD